MTTIELKIVSPLELEWEESYFPEDNYSDPVLNAEAEDYYGRRYSVSIYLDEDEDLVEMTGVKDGTLYEDYVLKVDVLDSYYGEEINAIPLDVDMEEFRKNPDKLDGIYNVEYVLVRDWLVYDRDWKTIEKHKKEAEAYEAWKKTQENVD